MTIVLLDSRQARIARRLLADATPATLETIAQQLNLTTRVVRYNLPPVESYLREAGLSVMKRRGVGIWVDGDAEGRRRLLVDLDRSAGPRVLAGEDRKLRAVAALLDASPQPVPLADLELDLGASRPTVRRDVRATETWLEEHHLHVQRLPGVGVAVRGSEAELRKALLALILETLPTNAIADALDRSSLTGTARPGQATVEEFVASLDLPRYRRILREQLVERDDNGPMAMIETLFIAIVARRVRRGHHAAFQSGQLRSLVEHPVADAAARIAAAVGQAAELTLTDGDVASITEFILGFAELDEEDLPPEPNDGAVIERIVTLAAARLHPSLAEDDQLRRNLAEHLRRLRVRLRYGLPITNPLDEEVRERYPDVHAVASAVVAELGACGDVVMPQGEIGFLTMYLAGSLERHRLRQKVRVTVVCPAGMATAWILVSRLAAEFPQIEVTRVVSKSAFAENDAEASDFVVSTVPLDEPTTVQTIVVSPLLRERDVRRLARIFGEPTH
ncbi:MAG TPA: PRD domain-containing protein [Candidatus Acidoferrales bacterium]|nr:PRD domain-containing protein [Candidatus Acidoferrales bacterium]